MRFFEFFGRAGKQRSSGAIATSRTVFGKFSGELHLLGPQRAVLG